jgi:hypothetical protein
MTKTIAIPTRKIINKVVLKTYHSILLKKSFFSFIPSLFSTSFATSRDAKNEQGYATVLESGNNREPSVCPFYTLIARVYFRNNGEVNNFFVTNRIKI